MNSDIRLHTASARRPKWIHKSQQKNGKVHIVALLGAIPLKRSVEACHSYRFLKQARAKIKTSGGRL